jgi:hypothetical protein
MEKHLEFIQEVINRMAKNSFMIKGWAVTLVSALFALAAKDTNQKFIIIAYFPVIVFWFLDGYYLYQERLFRKLFDKNRVLSTTNYSMKTTEFDNGINDWFSACLSKTIILFYGVILITLLIGMYFMQ